MVNGDVALLGAAGAEASLGGSRSTSESQLSVREISVSFEQTKQPRNNSDRDLTPIFVT
jgi:hypothetical protein